LIFFIFVLQRSLSNAGLNGTLSSTIGKLIYLTYLNFKHNQLHSTIPILSAMNLQELYLKKKKSIYILNNLKNLLYSDLSFNEFNGTLPLLPDSIELLDLSHNLLDDLPSSLPFQLRRLDLSHNEFKLIHLPSVSPRIDPQQCILYGDSDENCFLNVTNNECGSCFGAFGCSRREVFNPGCVDVANHHVNIPFDIYFNIDSNNNANVVVDSNITNRNEHKSINSNALDDNNNNNFINNTNSRRNNIIAEQTSERNRKKKNKKVMYF